MDLASVSQKQLLDLWEEEIKFDQRDKILSELKRRNLFPSVHEYMYEMTTGAYPDASLTKERGQFYARDPEFLQKLMARREFAESIQHDWQPPSDPCEDNLGFEITPVQRFVANFMSPKTPYESALLFHGVGVGKTCAAVQIAENWLAMYPNRKVVIVAPKTIRAGFMSTIFDITRLKFGKTAGQPNTITGCTGSTYLELSDTLFLSPDKKKFPKADEYEKEVQASLERIQDRVNAQIKRRYEFYGYRAFANHIIKIIKHSQTIKDDLAREEDEKERICEMFDGTLLIIDEAHNLREIPTKSRATAATTATAATAVPADDEAADEDNENPGGDDGEDDEKGGKVLTPYLDLVVKYTVGMKLVLMTATPMYNSYREIIHLLNLLLKNDGQAILRDTDIFGNLETGEFRENGAETLGLIASRYVSFMRGENPKSFPLRLKPANQKPLDVYPYKTPRSGKVNMEETEYVEHLPLEFTELSGDPLEAVRYYSSQLTVSDNGISSRDIKKIVQAGNLVVPLPDDINDGDPHWDSRIDIQALQLHFSKRVVNGELVWEPRSATSAAWLGLDQLGACSPKFAKVIPSINATRGVCFVFTRFVGAGAIPFALALEANGYLPYGRKTGMLGGGAVTPGGLQCALCDHRETNHSGQNHKFTVARYALLTGEASEAARKNFIDAEKMPDNVRGGRIKVVIGSEVASEGVDLKYVREIHVLDPWYHLNKTEQIIGRGIRYRSHCALPAEERNTTIYLHTAIRPAADRRESGDLYSYRVAFRKGQQAGRVTRVLKQYAIDCNLNHDAILIDSADPMKEVLDSQGNMRENVPITDMPFTAVCDWMEECDYKCAVPLDVDPGKADDISYDEFSAKWREAKLKERLRAMFAKQAYYSIEKMSSLLLGDVPKAAQADLLYKIVGNKAFSVNHNGREGYIIYKNGYYLFQPIRFVDIDIPLALRISSYPIKVETYQPHDIFGEVMQRLKARKEAVEAAEEEGDEEAAAAAAADIDVADEEFAAVTAPKKEAGRTVEELVALWAAYERWFADLTSYDDIVRINKRIYPKEVGAFIQERAGDEAKELTRLVERYQVLQWFAGACLPWTPEKKKWYTVSALQLVWDEEFEDEDRVTMLFERELMPESMAAAANTHYFTHKSTRVTRYINADTNDLEYYCNGRTKCDKSIIDLFDLKRKPKEAPRQTSDPLSTLVINATVTGQLYGFVTTEKGGWVFKSSRPPTSATDKLKLGEKCDNVSNINKHRVKVVELGEIMAAAGKGNYSLTEEILDKSKRKIENVKRMCMLLDFVLRYMDNMGVQGRRWFYRPIEARKAGHGGKA